MTDAQRWSGMRIVILGAARQGTALARYLIQHGARVVLSDLRKWEDLEDARQALANLADAGLGSPDWVCGGHPLELLDGADLLCPSGGFRLTNRL